MGLCKCPKRQVTNQFCFEHRVNVCENCMVQSHSKCIVQSYLQWLRDSDYVSNCTLCSTSLEQGECVRLICYHVFHWDCLNARQSSLPANTAPRGHQCPICEIEILPTSNLVSPVADELKVYLQKANWARNGLNLALLSDGENSTLRSTTQSTANNAFSSVTKVHHAGVDRQRDNNNDIFSSTTLKQNSPHSVLLMDAFTPPSTNEIHTSSRRSLLPRQTPIGGSGDRDDNKYKRRTPAEIFSRWSRRFYAPSSRPPWRRTWFIAVSGILIFLLIIYLMASLGRGGLSEADDSWNNPNSNVHYE